MYWWLVLQADWLKKPVGGFGQFGAKIALADMDAVRLKMINNEL